MACAGRYAEAFDYGLQWCKSAPTVGTDSGAGVDHLSITDATKDFTRIRNLEVGSPIYNATRRTYGKVTAVAATQLGTSSLFSNGESYWVLAMAAGEVAQIEHFLGIAAGDIHAARAAVDACDCTLAEGAVEYLRKLNILDAAVWHNCPCDKPEISDARFLAYMQEVRTMLDDIASGKTELCQGETGSQFPAVDWAEHSYNEWNANVIIRNRLLRQGY